MNPNDATQSVESSNVTDAEDALHRAQDELKLKRTNAAEVLEEADTARQRASQASVELKDLEQKLQMHRQQTDKNMRAQQESIDASRSKAEEQLSSGDKRAAKLAKTIALKREQEAKVKEALQAATGKYKKVEISIQEAREQLSGIQIRQENTLRSKQAQTKELKEMDIKVQQATRIANRMKLEAQRQKGMSDEAAMQSELSAKAVARAQSRVAQAQASRPAL